ncbi:gephyrin-like molybdotransferase Glp [Gordonia sp. NB41Y]|uniref:molybdopterin molybdotransferase MoeA n=1 Tax=Gordonia sp. NB41Y TaxID=875808 RepID=UPI0006B19065|nr:gephyrin-like molybdotransferase Glp [Gordonia sp. NB41Y]EMP10720.2 molybdopterin molybdenumtransferase [Gordonia sp. NB41Y]WLP92348.1 molybdopterin molybdotransferase MoeA [Gordonia sp. NB41Y]
MRSVAEHQQTIAALFAAPDPVRLAVADAHGSGLLDHVVAPISLPGFDNSAMDGFAVRAADLAGATPDAPVRLPVAADIPAGRTDAVALAPRTAHRIMTGAPLPDGADAVVPVEDTDASFAPGADSVSSGTVGFHAAPTEGRHIRRAGSDITAGEVALAAGATLGAPQIGLLAALGIAEVNVARRLRVVVLSTGSELVAAGTPLQHGQIYESNSAMLAAAAREAGALGRHEHFVPDDVPQFLAKLDATAGDADLIITSGGVSAGAFEVVKEALTDPADTGHAVEFVKVAMQPGMPQGAGVLLTPVGRRVPIITLPGNPVSSLVSFEVFIRPALRTAMALPDGRRRVTARLTADLRSPADKRQFMRGVITETPDGAQVVPIGPPGSHHLRFLAEANALIDVPVEVTAVAAGESVDVIVL